MTKRPMTPRELVVAGGHGMLAAHFGPEMLARLLDLERDMVALLALELPDADVGRRAWWAGQLAFVVATDQPWFAGITRERPSKQTKALSRVHKAARELLQALDALPEGADFGVDMRLLMLDLPGPAMRQVLLRERLFRTAGPVNAGLRRRKAAVAELALAAGETREGIGAVGRGKHRADRLARHVGDAFEDLGAAVTVSGTGEGPYPHVVQGVLEAAALWDASGTDVARREAERRRDAASHSGEIEQNPRKVSTRRRAKP
jgi:hypothetical protein